MAHDARRARTVMFGGDCLAGGLRNDTWEWDGMYWTQMADLIPEARHGHAMCFDAKRGTTLLFGGQSDTVHADTWCWNGDDWTQFAEDGPPPRAGHALAFDPQRGNVVLFGGAADGAPFNDTWEWDGEVWTQRGDSGPSPRRDHVLGFDRSRGTVVLCGGETGEGEALADTWSWDGSRWTRAIEFGPDAAMCAGVASTDFGLVMYGGLTPPDSLSRATWVFDGRRWTRRQTLGPGPRARHAMAWDVARRAIVLFGGQSAPAADADTAVPADLLGDTWEHMDEDGPQVPPPPPPPRILLALDPTAGPAGTLISVTLTLPAASEATVAVTLAWTLKATFDAANGKPAPADVTGLEVAQIAPGLTTTSKRVVAPGARAPIVILAILDEDIEAHASFDLA